MHWSIKEFYGHPPLPWRGRRGRLFCCTTRKIARKNLRKSDTYWPGWCRYNGRYGHSRHFSKREHFRIISYGA